MADADADAGVGLIRILVLDRGFVLVGRCEARPEDVGLWLPVSPCVTVRRWGTTRGLAELCGGPTGETVLDAVCPRAVIPVRALLVPMEVSDRGAEAWAAVLGLGGETRGPGVRSRPTGTRNRG